MNSFRQFNISLLIAIPLSIGIYLSSIYFFYVDVKDNSFSIQTYFEFKENYAKRIKGNKILFSSGSNNFLGIRAYQIENEFNVPAVNLSIHAGLGPEYIVERVKRIAKKGDVVILPLEYGNLTYNGNESVVLNKYILSYDKAYFNSNFNLEKKLSMLSSISILDLFSQTFFPITNVEKENIKIQFLKDLNVNGDMLNMTKHDSLKTKKIPFKLTKPINLETEALKEIAEFNNYCKENDILFYMSFPNIVYDKAYDTEDYNFYFNFLNQYFLKNKISVIGTPKNAMYPRELFFDSEYHLISKGSDIRTKDFINLIHKDSVLLERINHILEN